MSHGKLRQGQVITTYGPGALIDLPRHSAIVGGLETWPSPSGLDEIVEQRLSRALEVITGVPLPRLYAPPPEPDEPWAQPKDIGAWRFPEWFVVQEAIGEGRGQRRRLVHRKALERGRYDNKPVVPTRFVRACPRGHVDDLDWVAFVHGDKQCRRDLWLVEQGTSGDLSDLVVRCDCGASRPLYEAAEFANQPLGTCSGARPWLGNNTAEDCNLPSRLLIRTASNAYFPQVVSVLSLPDRGTDADRAVGELWDILQAVDSQESLQIFKRLPQVSEGLEGFSDEEVLAVIDKLKHGPDQGTNLKSVELDALLGEPEGYGDDIPINPNFHARRLPEDAWRNANSSVSAGIECVIQLHRLREVLALIGFTRLEAVMRDHHGGYDTDVERAQIAIEPEWFPAVENRGEGVFLQLRTEAVNDWLARPPVQERIKALAQGHLAWQAERKSSREFPGGPYILVHTLAHLLIQSFAMRCGYPASSIRERIYAEGERYGILLYTGSPDAEGTLGGLVQQARHIEDHLAEALRMGALCSNDPVCAQHEPGTSMEQRWLHGAACHGCSLIAETSCEMQNDQLDRALVVPTLGPEGTAFFPTPE